MNGGSGVMDRKKDAFDRTLAKHVRETMKGHKKVKKHGTHVSRRVPLTIPSDIEGELKTAEARRERQHEIHSMLNIGMETLFPDTQQERQACIIEDTDEGTNATIRALKYKCNMRIMDMDMDDIDDLIYILDLFDESTGAWYWQRCADEMELAMNARLRVLEEEEENGDG